MLEAQNRPEIDREHETHSEIPGSRPAETGRKAIIVGRPRTGNSGVGFARGVGFGRCSDFMELPSSSLDDYEIDVGRRM